MLNLILARILTRMPVVKVLRIALVGTVTSVWATAVFPVDFTGAGSTFVNPVMLKWAAAYHAKSGVELTYRSIGSGAGIRHAKAGTVTFGASDRPLPPEDLRAAGLMQFPVVIGGVVPVVNLDGVKAGELKLTGEVLADIYLGRITVWTDPAIRALNPDATLPPWKISVVHRLDGSGSTFNWVNFLSRHSADWKEKVGVGTTVKWPTGIGGTGNDGVARYVGAIKGAIGYVELTYAVRARMTFTTLRNRDGVFVAPSQASFQAAAAGAEWTAPDFYQVLTDAPGAASWPITATVFVLMPKSPPDPAKAEEAMKFFRWVLHEGRAEAASLAYVPLPDGLVKRVEGYWTRNEK